MDKYVIGVDFGSDSVRTLLVSCSNGDQVATSVKYYTRWKAGRYCDPSVNRYRQHPLDYVESLEAAILEMLSNVSDDVRKRVVAISFDTTGSTPVFTDRAGKPLALTPGFEENPNAMFVLWKDHTAIKEAAEINELAARWSTNYIAYEGGIYSSEWFWAKALHLLREDEKVIDAAFSIVEHCDWMSALLTGVDDALKIKRSRCAAGHKAMWLKEWGGLPATDFLGALDPVLPRFRDNLYADTFTSDTSCGTLTEEWAQRFGLSTSVAVGVGAFDCHMGAVGAGITEHSFVRVIGTSTCDIMVSSYEEMGNKLIPGICGQVDGSVIPGYIGLEAGQSGFGDIYAWYKRVLEFPMQIIMESDLLDASMKQKLVDEVADRIIPTLEREALKIPIEESGVWATDWMNGRRTPDANQLLKGTITGISLATTAPMIYRALVEATAFGSRAIVERFRSEGVRIDNVIGIGGISKKSPFVMQTLADVLNMPIQVCETEQACALGAAIFAAVAAGVYPTVEEAQKAMASGYDKVYTPIQENVALYNQLYKKYCEIGTLTEPLFK